MASRDGLQRFVEAQEPVYATALQELTSGRKRTHWMWFIFPQLRGLGLSSTAEFYGLASLDEAKAYLAHRSLAERLLACTAAVLAVEGRTVGEIFGAPDDVKFHSSMTIFTIADGRPENPYHLALAKYCGDELDRRTLALLDR